MHKVLVLGASGLLGSSVLRVLAAGKQIEPAGAVRDPKTVAAFAPYLADLLVPSGDLRDLNALAGLLDRIAPDVVVNCVAVRRSDWSKPEEMTALFSLLPRRLDYLCRVRDMRLVHFSSDGVFSGRRGHYAETDIPDADDAYGVAKILGEVSGPGVLTIRTSMVGPDPAGRSGLLSWFLLQQEHCAGYSRAIFSGLPTVELGRIVRDVILPRPDLSGIYHVAADPISKFDLLGLIAAQYNKSIAITDDPRAVMDRSLDSGAFGQATDYRNADWPTLVRMMYEDHQTIGL